MDIYAEKRLSRRMGGMGQEMHYLAFLFIGGEQASQGGLDPMQIG